MIKYSEEIKSMNLWEKIANVSAEIENLQKDDKIGYGASAYKAITIEKVVKSVGEKMNKYGVVIYPIQQNYTRTDEKIIKKDGGEGINRISDVDVTYQVVNIHNPIEMIITVASGTGVDTQDKGIGKAQTYAYKNMLLKLFAIPTGDDTDKIHSDVYTNELYGVKEDKDSKKLKDVKEDVPVSMGKKVESKEDELISNDERKELFLLARGLKTDIIKEILHSYGFEGSEDVTKKEFRNICEIIEKSKEMYGVNVGA